MTIAVDVAVIKLYASDKAFMVEYLTDISVNNAGQAVQRWHELGYDQYSK